MPVVIPYSDEQARALVNLRQRYEVWIGAEQVLAQLPYDLRRKEVAGHAYLYQIHDRGGNGTSLGPWSADNEARFTAYREEKQAAKSRRDTVKAMLAAAMVARPGSWPRTHAGLRCTNYGCRTRPSAIRSSGART